MKPHRYHGGGPGYSYVRSLRVCKVICKDEHVVRLMVWPKGRVRFVRVLGNGLTSFFVVDSTR